MPSSNFLAAAILPHTSRSFILRHNTPENLLARLHFTQQFGLAPIHNQLDYNKNCESASRAKLFAMTTIAEDLLNDFESDDEAEDQQNGELFADHGYSDEGLVDPTRNLAGASNGDHMELEGDEEQQDDEDPDAAAPSHLKMEDAEDEEEAKARIEKMQLASVSDVRSVAGLMRQLEPVMEVSKIHFTLTRRRIDPVYNV